MGFFSSECFLITYFTYRLFSAIFGQEYNSKCETCHDVKCTVWPSQSCQLDRGVSLVSAGEMKVGQLVTFQPGGNSPPYTLAQRSILQQYTGYALKKTTIKSVPTTTVLYLGNRKCSLFFLPLDAVSAL